MKVYTIAIVLLACGSFCHAGTLSNGVGIMSVFVEGIGAQSVPVAQFTDSDPNESVANLMAIINWGDGTTSPGMIGGGSGSFTVSGGHTYIEEGQYSISVAASNAGSQLSIGSQASVFDAPLTPAASPSVFGEEGSSLSGIVGNFTDGNVFGSASDFTAIINWGDGTSSPGTVAGQAGQYTVAGTHIYAHNGTYTITSNVSDTASTVTTGGSAQVFDAPLTPGQFLLPSLVEGNSFAGFVATFSDGDPFGAATDFTATIDWGDGTMSAGAIVPLGNATFGVEGQHTYLATGLLSVSANVLDSGASTVDVLGNETVNPAPEPGSPIPVALGLGFVVLLYRRPRVS